MHTVQIRLGLRLERSFIHTAPVAKKLIGLHIKWSKNYSFKIVYMDRDYSLRSTEKSCYYNGVCVLWVSMIVCGMQSVQVLSRSTAAVRILAALLQLERFSEVISQNSSCILRVQWVVC